MIFRLIIIAIILAAVYHIFKSTTGSQYKRCEKCDGKGYWRAIRGEKDKCDVCQGSGKTLRNR
ncbi:hypothetical protein N9954_01415 [Maribacter sp.]|nr:hypothetical protein [Maribacter sp.]